MTSPDAASAAMPPSNTENNPRRLGMRTPAGSNSGMRARVRRRPGQSFPSAAKETSIAAEQPTTPPKKAFHFRRAIRNTGSSRARWGLAAQAENANPAQKSYLLASSLIPSATKNRKKIESWPRARHIATGADQHNATAAHARLETGQR